MRYGYHPHNVHFIVTSAMMAGDLATAQREAQRLRGLLDAETSARIGWIQAIDGAPYQAMAQFAGPTAILALPAPDARLPLATAMYHYARAVAQAANKDAAGFATTLAALQDLTAHPGMALLAQQAVPAADLIRLAGAVARGRWAMAQGSYGDAAGHFRAAITIEAAMPYMEPRFWHYPVSQSLGAALLLSGDHAGATAAFRAALAQAPGNGWALYGLAQSEAAAGHKPEAAAANRALRRAWAGDPRWLKLERL